MRLIAPDQTTVLRKGEVKFALQDAAYHATNVTLFGRWNSKCRAYFVEVLVDDVMKLRYPVPVIVARRKQPGGPNPQAAGSRAERNAILILRRRFIPLKPMDATQQPPGNR